RVEEAVLVDVLLVLELLLVGELGHGLLVLAVELLHGLRVPLLGPDVLLRAAGDDGLIVGAVVSLEVALGLGNELRDLGLVLGLDLLGLFELLLELGRALLLLFSGIDAVALEVLKAVLYVQDLVSAVQTQGVYLLLYGADVLVYRRKELSFLLSGQNLCVFCNHKRFLLPYRYFALSLRSSSWSVSFVFTMPERCPLDMTPMRFVMPRISGISEDTTIIVFPCLAMRMMSS